MRCTGTPAAAVADACNLYAIEENISCTGYLDKYNILVVAFYYNIISIITSERRQMERE